MEAGGETSTSIGMLLALGAIIVLINAVFVAAELALLTSRRVRLQSAADMGSRPARLVLHMLDKPDRAIAAIQLGVTSASILLGIVAEEPLSELLTSLLAPTLGVYVGEAAAGIIATILVLVILSFVLMVVGEQTPKIIAIRYPESTIQLFVIPLQVFARITSPFVALVDKTTTLVLRLFGIRGATSMHGIATVEELRAMVEQSGEVGILDEEEQRLLSKVFDFGDRIVREVMVPRPNIIGIEQTETVAEMLTTFRQYRHSRFPVYAGDIDHVVGVLSTKDLLAELVDHPDLGDRPISGLDIIQAPMTVPETRLVGELFVEMRARRTGLAIVIDEYGGTAGLVTLEELVEEIVGRMTDEWTSAPALHQVSEQQFEVEAQLRVEEFNEMTGFALPESDAYETLAGLILYQLRHIPEVGEEAATPDYQLRVLAMEGPKIVTVRIRRLS